MPRVLSGLEGAPDVIRSMTAFARAQHDAGWGVAIWELRSVNNRYLDVATRLPETLRGLESEIRDRLRARLNRGKVDCHLRVTYQSVGMAGFDVDRDLVRRVARASREVEAFLVNPAPVNALDLLQWPGVIRSPAVDPDLVAAGVLHCFDAACGELVAARAREGDRIAGMLVQRLDAIQEIVDETRASVPTLVATARRRLATRLADLEIEVDGDRLEQEIVLVAQKADVAEELDRLEAHVAEVRRALGEERPAGRRLDFLMQELNREANTLGAKSIDLERTRASVDLKVLIEQMREQIQNVE